MRMAMGSLAMQVNTRTSMHMMQRHCTPMDWRMPMKWETPRWKKIKVALTVSHGLHRCGSEKRFCTCAQAMLQGCWTRRRTHRHRKTHIQGH